MNIIGIGVVNMKKEKVHWTKLEMNERMKYEVAEEIGLLDKILDKGWENLTARENGRIGGLVTNKKKKLSKIDNLKL